MELPSQWMEKDKQLTISVLNDSGEVLSVRGYISMSTIVSKS